MPASTPSHLAEPATDGWAGFALRWSLARSPFAAIAAIVMGLAASWLSTYLTGGAGTVVPHLYYVPIVFAAVRFSVPAAALVAVVSGLLAGPFTYLDVATAVAQDPQRWLTRAGFFLLIGVGLATLVRPSLPTLANGIRTRRAEQALSRAIADGELFLRFQPVIDVRTGQLHGVEALVRWQHPTHGELGPGAFLPLAEAGEVIHELGSFVFADACRHAARWQAMASEWGRPPPIVAVNMSARELESAALIERVGDELARSGLDPAGIWVEVTESTLAADVELSAARLTDIKSLGVQLAVDDFGTGYSSLSSVHRFPVDILKIDRSFLASVTEDPQARTLLGGIVLFARSLGLQTVAEGVERAEQGASVRELGFDLVQGFHYARPLLAEEIDPLVGRPADDEVVDRRSA